MNKPEILGVNLCGCVSTGTSAGVWTAVASAACITVPAAAILCNVPVVGVFMAL